MDRIPRAHNQPLAWPGQVSRSVTNGSGRDLEADDGKVRTQG